MRTMSSFKLTADTRKRLTALAEKTGQSMTAVLESSIAAVDLGTLQNPPQQPAYREREPEAHDMPQLVQQWHNPFRSWDPGSLLNAKSQADNGSMQLAWDLCESMLADTTVAGGIQLRVNGLAGLPVRFTGGNEDVLEAVSTDFFAMETAGEASFRRVAGLLLNIVPCYVRELLDIDGRLVPRLEPWNPRWLRWRWQPGGYEWFIQTADAEIRLADQPGRWFLYCPLGFAGGRPWVNGLWYSLCTWWLAKSYAIADLAAFGQSHATPKWFLSQIEGTIAPGTEKEAEKRKAISYLSRLPERPGMYVPFGFKVTQEETTSTAWQSLTAQIDLADKAMTRDILGSDAGTNANTTYASAHTGDAVRWDLTISDADAETSWWHDGPGTLWHALNFRGRKQLQAFGGVLDLQQDHRGHWALSRADERPVSLMLSEEGNRRHLRFLSGVDNRVRSGDEVPWPTRDATPSEDLAKVAETQGKAATALVQLTTAAAADPNVAAALAKIDIERYIGRYFPMKGEEESGVQLEMEDGTILELKGKTGSGWITINGTHVHATPGKKVDFKGLRATAGGQKSGSGSLLGDAGRAATKPKTIDPATVTADSGYAAYAKGMKARGRKPKGEAEHRAELVKSHLGQDMSNEQIAGLVGVHGANNYKVDIRGDAVQVSIDHPEFTMKRTFTRDEDGKTVCNNDFLEVKGEQGKGLGSKVFGEQVESLRQNGIDRMTTHAARETTTEGKQYNGYYTWPRLGYNGAIPADLQADLPKGLKGSKDLHDLMKTKSGRDWWKQHGTDVDVHFDLSKDSASSKIFDAYRAEKGK